MPPPIFKRPRVSAEPHVVTTSSVSKPNAGARAGSVAARGQLSEEEERARQVAERGRQDARRLLASARAEAERIRAREREAGYQEGYQEGLAKGHEAGEQAAREAFEGEVGDHLRRLGELVVRAGIDRAALLRSAEADLVELALAIAEKVLHQRVGAGERSAALDIAREGLERVAAVGNDAARVRVHPDDYELYREMWDQLELEGAAGVSCQVVPDERVEPGGCLIETRAGRVDGQWGTQLAQIRGALLGASPEGTSADQGR